MKSTGNFYFDSLISDALSKGEELSYAKSLIIRALLQSVDKLVIIDPHLTEEQAVGMVQQLSMAGIRDVYIHSDVSNQMDIWMAIDAFGMKLRGIEVVFNPQYTENQRNFGDGCGEDKVISAFHFSFD